MRNPVSYRPSGRVPVLIVPAMLFSLSLAVPGAFAYAWADARMPWFLSILTIWPFAFWLGCLAKWTALLAQVRNPLVMKECGVVLAVVGWACHWVFWIIFVSYPDVRSLPGGSIVIPAADMFAEPLAPLRALWVALQATEWGDDIDVDILRGVGWLLEFTILVTASTLAGAVQAEKPYCEAGRRWARVIRLPYRFAADHLAGARAHLMAHPDQLLAALSPAKSLKRYAMATLFRGDDLAYLCVDEFESWSDGRRQTYRRNKLLRYCVLPTGAADDFLARVSTRMSKQAPDNAVPWKKRFLLWLEDQYEPSSEETRRLLEEKLQ